MKRLPLFFLWLLLGAGSIGCTRSTTVTLCIRNTPPGELCALLPTDGGAAIAALDTIRWSTDTTVAFSVNTSGEPTAITLFGSGIKPVYTVCGTESFSITLNPADSLHPVWFEGPNAAGRTLLQKIIAGRNPYKYEFVRNYTLAPLDTVPEKMDANFWALAGKDIVLFDSLLATGQIDKKFRDYAALDAMTYQALSLSKVLRANFYDAGEDLSAMRAGYGALWSAVYEKVPVTYAACRTSSGLAYANLRATSYKAYTDAVSGNPGPEYTTPENWRKRLLDAAGQFQDVDTKKAYIAYALFFECLNNKTYDTTILVLLNRYANDYPDSRMNQYFTKHRAELSEYYRTLAEADTTQICMIPDPENMQTLTAVLKRFKGKPVFIDFWFSTCGPCLQEMKQSGPLKAWLKEHGIEILYISIDNSDMDYNWQNAIKFNKLYGYHLRTTQKLHEDLYETYGIQLFPTYMLVDATGRIVIPRAKTPSSGSELTDEIAAALQMNK